LPPPSFVDEDIIKESDETVVDQNELRKLSDEIVTKVFVDRKNHYTIFKAFDTDCDGFISYQDFTDKVR